MLGDDCRLLGREDDLEIVLFLTSNFDRSNPS
jgi:hypothetical protein